MNKQWFRTWHRRIGIASIGMVLWLALSGILINHSDMLGFNKSTINNSFINRLYGLDKTVDLPQAIVFGEAHFFCYEGQLYRNDDVLALCGFPPLAIGVFDNQVLVLSESDILLFDKSFNFLEKIDFSSLANDLSQQKVRHLWRVGEQIILASEGDGYLYRLDILALETERLEVLPAGALSVSEAVEFALLPADIRKNLAFPGLSLERLLLDAHSGRLFGIFGVLLVDFFAIAFVLLGLSGFLLFFRKSV